MAKLRHKTLSSKPSCNGIITTFLSHTEVNIDSGAWCRYMSCTPIVPPQLRVCNTSRKETLRPLREAQSRFGASWGNVRKIYFM